MKLKIAILVSFLIFATDGMAEDLPPLPEGPLLLTSTTSEQLKPEYWINRLPNPNQVLKTPEELKVFNEEIDAMIPENVNIFKLGTSMTGSQIRKQIQLEYDTVSGRKLFGVDGQYIQKDLFTTQIEPVLALGQIPDKIVLQWGIATKATSVRALPSKIKMMEDKTDFEFDQLQFTLIKLWTPVAIYHLSQDRDWYYVQAPYVRGWVQAKDIAIFKTRAALKEKVNSKSFLVVTGESIPIFSDANHQKRFGRASMGTVIPLAEKGDGHYVVWMPFRSADGSASFKKGYVSKKSDVRENFPPYTQANVIRQAFKLLGARYGWGGMYNGRDCSGFTHDVFLSMGVFMPRDSKRQPYAGTQLGHFKPYEDAGKKAVALRSATPGITLLRMPLHMMIYLGEGNDHFYVIHSTWAERIGMDPVRDEKRRINQVIVSDLSLNGNSYLGGLFDRIIQISEVN